MSKMKLRILIVIIVLIFAVTLVQCKKGERINPEIEAPGKTSSPTALKIEPVERDTDAAIDSPGTPETSAEQQTRRYEAQFFSVKLPGQLDYKKLKETGISKMIVRVFQDEGKNGGLFFRNSLFRTIASRLEEVSLEIATLNTDLKIDLCAWMITRKFNWVSDTGRFDYEYKTGGRRMIRKYDLFNPEAVDRIVRVYRELAVKNIECILIQDDFFYRYNEGFSNWGKAAFAKATGLPARENLMMRKNTPYNKKWNQVKKEQINKVLTLIIKNCKEVNPGVKIGMNIYYETPLYVEQGEAWYAHNLREIVATGIDYIYLMSYQRQIKEELNLTESNNRIMFRRILERALETCKEKLIVKLQTRDWGTGRRIPVSEVRAYLDIIPEDVKRICFTPIKPGDYDYLKALIRTRADVVY